MKILLSGTLATLALLCGVSMAQDATPSPSTTPAPQAQQNPMSAQSAAAGSAQATAPRIAPGSVIPVQLTKSIDAKKVKTGDAVEATVTQDMKAGNGEVIVPKDTKVVGRVTEAQARNKEQKESQVGIVFDHAVMKTGGDVNLPMSIQAIIAPSYLSTNNSSNSEGAGQSPSTASATGMSQGTGGARGGAMGGSQPSTSTSTPTPSGGTGSTQDKTGNGARQPITGNTQGVLGIPNLTLSTTAGTAQGSVVTSEKNNVKLESGTMMLLRVDQPGPAKP
jgi:hypothetical protein